jgi:hypothetical protein
VVLQEWLAEALTMWGLAAVVTAATLVGGAGSPTTVAVYRVAAGLGGALAVLPGLTGARTPVIWFKVFPVLLTTSAAVLLAASVM